MFKTALKERKIKGAAGAKAEKKVVTQRLKILQETETIGSVSKACRRFKISRSSFYRYKERFQKCGLKGLKNLSCRPHECPQKTSGEIVDKVISFARKHSSWGCSFISQQLKSIGISVSASTVWKILTKERSKAQSVNDLK